MSRAAVLLLGILAGLPATGCRPAPETASAVARQQDFEHRIGADGVLKAARVTPITAPAQIRRRVRIAWLAPDGARVEAGEVVARFDAEEIEERLEEARSDLERNDLERAKSESETRSQMASLEAERRKAELDLDLARRFLKTDDELYSRFEILEDAVDEDLASERSDNARHLEELQRSSSKAGLELLSIDQRKARVDLEQAEEALSALEVRAPHAGILTWARDWSGEMLAVGATAWRGQTLGEIPDLAELQAEVYVLEADAGGVTAGQPAEVVVEAHPERRYAATVVRVDAVARPAEERESHHAEVHGEDHETHDRERTPHQMTQRHRHRAAGRRASARIGTRIGARIGARIGRVRRGRHDTRTRGSMRA